MCIRDSVAGIHVIPAHNVRNDREHNFAIDLVDVLGPEQVLQDRDLRQEWNSRQSLVVFLLQDAAQQVDIAVLQADLVLHLALSNYGWLIPPMFWKLVTDDTSCLLYTSDAADD